MSHISENTTNIRVVNQAILQETIELVVKATPGMTVETHYKDWDMNKVKCDLALYTPSMHRGLAINFKNGGLSFKGDFYGANEEVKRLQSLIKQTYYAVATKKALESIDYEVASTTQLQNGNFVVQTA